ncbi:MAG: hypothetical protein A2Z20_11440 [Bdellovibrionales bacterium RBG_16_40_8]|nr:MAG: hypothetical protein A2Z20_11440 [Bdellovibrionales bacterium RBG_16_40_8]
MARIEKFQPQLKPGKLIPQGERIVFEIENPVDQVVLPLETVDFLLLCNGEHTVGEIIERLYHRKGAIQFKTIYKTLIYLRDRGFLENGEELIVHDKQESINNTRFFSFKPFFEIEVGKRIFSGEPRLLHFYFTSMITILTAILSFQMIESSAVTLKFFNLSNSFVQGLFFLFITSSILLTIKNLFQCLLLLYLTGRAYNFSFVFTGYAFYFRVKSDSLFLVSDRLYLFLYYLATSLCYFPIVACAFFFFPNLPYLNESMSLALLLCLFDLNPFQNSKTSYLLRSLLNDDTVNRVSAYLKDRPLLQLVHPYERRQDLSLYLLYAHFATIWSVAMMYISYSAIGYHYKSFLVTMHTASLEERGSALIAFSILITLFCVMFYNVSKIIWMALILPASYTFLDYLRQRKSHRLQFFNTKEVISALTTLPLFNFFDNELLDMIVNRSELKEYKSHAPIIIQGDTGEHLYVLLSGKLQVRRRLPTGRIQNISQIMPISIFGEIAIIESTPRTADVVATQNSIILEIPARMIQQIAHNSQYVRELSNFQNAITVNQFFTSAPLFRELSEQVIQIFMSRGKIENYVEDQIIFKQGDPGDGFFLLLRGAVTVRVNDYNVARIQQGGFFGEISMIADVPRTATIFALEQTQVLKINRDTFWEILALDISMAMLIESVGEMRIREDIEIIKAGSARVA